MSKPQDSRSIEENHAWDRLSMWETYVDEKIRDWLGDGDMSWHPSAGKPLNLDDDSSVPPDQKLAYKIMKENDAVPAWMALGFTLRDKRDKLIARIQQYAADYTHRQAEAIRKSSFIMSQHAQDRWEVAIRSWRDDVAKYNREILNYNVQVPPQVPQMIPLNVPNMIEAALDKTRTATD